MRRFVFIAIVFMSFFSGSVVAQTKFSGYLQNVPVWVDSTPRTSSDIRFFNRLRVTSDAVFGQFSIGAAYEQMSTIRLQQFSAGFGIGKMSEAGEWLKLQWTAMEGKHLLWQHRFDRLQVGWSPSGMFNVTAGRQAVSWGTTLFLTPADPFVPFHPADPFREFRGGVDAARVRIYPGPLSEIDIVVRPTKTLAGEEELTLLARGLTTWKNIELSGWGGTLYGDRAVAVGVTGALGTLAIRGEAVVRSRHDGVVFRGTVGFDHFRQLRGRDFQVSIEYQRDGLGVADPLDYQNVLVSDTFRRGDHQVLGRDETVVTTNYQLNPLWSLSGLWLWNLNDHSALVSPNISYSAGDEVTISGGVFLGIGDGQDLKSHAFLSEYGSKAATAFLSLQWFF